MHRRSRSVFTRSPLSPALTSLAPVTGRPHNWAGNVVYSARSVHRPTSVGDLRALVAASAGIRALGTGHSFNRLPDCAGDLVSVADLPPTLTIDPAASTATVAAGLRYGEVAERLSSAGYALANLGSLPHISVAGACATATHGSGVGNGNVATSVAAVTMVGAGGDLMTLRRDSDPDFDGAVVALGALGVVVSLTLDIEPAFAVRQYVYDDLPWDRLDRLDEILASAYSVSLFTDWQGRDINMVWLKYRADEPGADSPPARWLGATLADTPRHPIAGQPVANCTQQLGVVGPWHERLPHFRLGFTPSSGSELQTEYLVARAHGQAALEAVARLRTQIARLVQVCEIRTVAADRLWLSPSYGRDSLAVHFTWVDDAASVAPAVAELEAQLAPLAPRPHWGKVFSLPPPLVRAGYERAADFVELRRRYDPAGVFGNDFVDSYFPTGR